MVILRIAVLSRAKVTAVRLYSTQCDSKAIDFSLVYNVSDIAETHCQDRLREVKSSIRSISTLGTVEDALPTA